MAELDIEHLGGHRYLVTIAEPGSSTSHEIRLAADDVDRFGAESANELVSASVRFLLDREPKEAIMANFDLRTIERFFPDFPDRVSRYL